MSSIPTPQGGHGPTDLEIVQQVRRWLDSKEAEIENRYLKRVCWLAEQQIKGRTVKALSAPSETKATGSWQPISKNPDLDGRLWPIVVVRDGKVTMDYEYYHFDNGWASDEEILNWWSLPITPVRGSVRVL